MVFLVAQRGEHFFQERAGFSVNGDCRLKTPHFIAVETSNVFSLASELTAKFYLFVEADLTRAVGQGVIDLAFELFEVFRWHGHRDERVVEILIENL